MDREDRTTARSTNVATQSFDATAINDAIRIVPRHHTVSISNLLHAAANSRQGAARMYRDR